MDISDDGFVSLLSMDGSTTKDDLKVPEGELGEKVRDEFNKGTDLVVTVMAALETEQIVSYRENQKA